LLRISEPLQIDAAPQDVWAILGDPHRVVRCFPGATLAESLGNDNYAGSLKMSFGPVAATFGGEVALQVDSVSRQCHIEGRGVDARQRNRTKVVADVREVADDVGSRTLLAIDAQIEVSGPLSQFAEAGGAQIARDILKEFSTRLAVAAAAQPASDTPSATSSDGPETTALSLKPMRILKMVLQEKWRSLRARWSRTSRPNH